MVNKFWLFFAVTSIVITGCVEKPKDIGSSSALIDPNNVASFADTTLSSTGTTTFLTPTINGYGGTNLVGRLADSEEVFTLIKFIPTVALDSLNGAVLDTVELHLTVNYKLKADILPATFEIYEVLDTTWSQGTITADSLLSISSSPVGSFTFADSLNDGQEIVCTNLDTSVVRRWINAYDDTSAPHFYGFAIRPMQGNVPGIVGFTTFTDGNLVYPTLTLRYTTQYTHDTLAFSYGEDTYIGKFNTTPASYPFSVRAGFAVRSKINFDPSFFKNKPIINQAKLTLFVDSNYTVKGGYSPDSLLMFLGVENDTVTNDYTTAYYAYGVLNTDSSGLQSYQFQAGTLFQLWVNNLYSNQGLILKWASETSASEKVTFYGSNDPDPEKHPTVKITYSTK
jgi:hypothetical protein